MRDIVAPQSRQWIKSDEANAFAVRAVVLLNLLLAVFISQSTGQAHARCSRHIS